MSRGMERKLLIVAASWNIITAIITIFGYSLWFKRTGVEGLDSSTLNGFMASSTFVDHISKVIVTFGLFIFVGSLISYIVAKNLRDDEIQYKSLIWIGCWGVIMLLSMDLIGFALYLITFVVYLSKNKAVKLLQSSFQS